MATRPVITIKASGAFGRALRKPGRHSGAIHKSPRVVTLLLVHSSVSPSLRRAFLHNFTSRDRVAQPTRPEITPSRLSSRNEENPFMSDAEALVCRECVRAAANNQIAGNVPVGCVGSLPNRGWRGSGGNHPESVHTEKRCNKEC